jgi:hypothetical protein
MKEMVHNKEKKAGKLVNEEVKMASGLVHEEGL